MQPIGLSIADGTAARVGRCTAGMPIPLLLAALAGAPALVGSYRCSGGGGSERVLTLRPDYSYTWGDNPAVGTWRFDRREGVFLIATGPLALRDPRDGRVGPGRVDLTLDDGSRLACRTAPPRR